MTSQSHDGPTITDLRDEHESARATLAAALTTDTSKWDKIPLPLMARSAADHIAILRERADRQAATIQSAKNSIAATLEGIGDRDADDAIGTLDDLIDEIVVRVEQLHRIVYTDAPKTRAETITQVITNIYNSINHADSVNPYGDITRRSALRAVIKEAEHRGVKL